MNGIEFTYRELEVIRDMAARVLAAEWNTGYGRPFDTLCDKVAKLMARAPARQRPSAENRRFLASLG
jgi:hypothetical protein